MSIKVNIKDHFDVPYELHVKTLADATKELESGNWKFPNEQRSYIWSETPAWCNELIETLINQRPMGVGKINAPGKNSKVPIKDIIDSQQRLTTILCFIKPEFIPRDHTENKFQKLDRNLSYKIVDEYKDYYNEELASEHVSDERKQMINDILSRYRLEAKKLRLKFIQLPLYLQSLILNAPFIYFETEWTDKQRCDDFICTQNGDPLSPGDMIHALSIKLGAPNLGTEIENSFFNRNSVSALEPYNGVTSVKNSKKPHLLHCVNIITSLAGIGQYSQNSSKVQNQFKEHARTILNDRADAVRAFNNLDNFFSALRSGSVKLENPLSLTYWKMALVLMAVKYDTDDFADILQATSMKWCLKHISEAFDEAKEFKAAQSRDPSAFNAAAQVDGRWGGNYKQVGEVSKLLNGTHNAKDLKSFAGDLLHLLKHRYDVQEQEKNKILDKSLAA